MPVSLVTGASTGIGFATALHLARNGHRVYAGLRNLSRGAILEKAAENEGLPVEIVKLDVIDDVLVERAVGQVLDREGRIDVLVNNAGVSGAAPLEETPDSEHRAMFEANYWGVIRMMKSVLPSMRERGAGTIINISSVTGRVAVPNQVAYSASKHAIEAASEALAAEVKSLGIRIAIVAPGVFATQIWENSAAATRYDRSSPYRQIMRWNGKMYGSLLRQAGDPARVAEVILQAIESDPPRLRWIVGEDAEAMISNRARASDEEFIELGAEMDDEEKSERYRKLLGISVR